MAATKPIVLNIPVEKNHLLVWMPDSSEQDALLATEQTLGQAGWRSTTAMEARLTDLLAAAGFPDRGAGHDGIDCLKGFIYEVIWVWGTVGPLSVELAAWLRAIADIGVDFDGEPVDE